MMNSNYKARIDSAMEQMTDEERAAFLKQEIVRRTGRTTRKADEWIQLIFNGRTLVCDMRKNTVWHEYGKHLFRVVYNRLKLEHGIENFEVKDGSIKWRWYDRFVEQQKMLKEELDKVKGRIDKLKEGQNNG